MTDQHPVTPPPELVQQWCLHSNKHETADQFWRHIATQAAQWGSDQELEACREWLRIDGVDGLTADMMYEARRPKPPSLKEQALTALSHLLSGSAQTLDTTEAEFYIRKALEQLP